MTRHTVIQVALTLFVSFALATAADAGLLVDFKPDPVSPLMYEIGWTGSQIVQRPGSVGNGDGTLPPSNQIPGGLNIQTPLNIVGIPGSTNNSTDGSTTFYDVTLQLTGLVASGAPVQTTIMPGMVWVSQPVGAGTFAFLSTDPDGAGPLLPTVLLSGTIDDAVVGGLLGSPAGSIQSQHVTFTGGVISVGSSSASLSWSLLDIGGGLTVIPGGSFSTTLQSFDANMTGQITPEPATLCLLGIGAATILVSRRKKLRIL
ncbi:MAG: PEP-CTERM sorting domain-containing protein [Planctomycetota bacterium]|nr:PEP-CTERM sorting domain-containing protein [Planctomycetota bacterium]